MSTTTYAADDTTTIASRLKELAAEREEARKQCDPEHANGDNLDRVEADWGEKRSGVESDYTFRNRLLRKIRGDA